MSHCGPEKEGTGASRSHSESGGTSFRVLEFRPWPHGDGDVWEPRVNSNVFPGKFAHPATYFPAISTLV